MQQHMSALWIFKDAATAQVIRMRPTQPLDVVRWLHVEIRAGGQWEASRRTEAAICEFNFLHNNYSPFVCVCVCV